MPTLITHALVGTAAAQTARPGWREWRFAAAAVFCSVLPDFDVIGFRFGVHYGDTWGHRGMMHSIAFAVIVGFALGFFFGHSWRERGKAGALLFAAMVSHDLLDALTSGGLGIALFAPFSNHRYFFPWTPIRVSPLGLHAFFGPRGARVMWSEVRWVWLPVMTATVLLLSVRRKLVRNCEQPRGDSSVDPAQANVGLERGTERQERLDATRASR